MSFIAELKRRKIIRVATLYAVVAWLLIQVSATLAPLMNLPDAAPRFVLFVLIILFPVALFLAWAYQLTPDGIRLDNGTTDGAPSGSPAANPAIVGSVLLVLAAGIGLYFHNRPPTPALQESAASALAESAAGEIVPAASEPELATANSIAVLPFTAFSANEDDRFFADGLSDTLLNKLAHLRGVRVISRSASFQYRGDAVDIARVGEELDVATVLEGSVQRSGDRLRIIAQLIDTASGGHIWSDTYDRSGDDIFAIHDEIAAAVVENLAISLTPEERERLQSVGTESVEAYTLLTNTVERWRALSPFNLSTQEYKERVYSLIDDIRRVLVIDPAYVEAYQAIARVYSSLLFQSLGDEDYPYHLRKGYEAVYRAMLLAPDDPENFLLFATMSRRERNFEQAESFARMAYARLPNSAAAASEISLVLTGQNKDPAEALAMVELEESLDPTGTNIYRRKIFALRALGRADEALEVARAALSSDPASQLASVDIAEILADGMGRYPEAFAALIDVRTRTEDNVGDALLAQWAVMASRLGLDGEREKLGPGAPGGASVELMRSDSDRSPASSGPLYARLAQLCFEERDFDCAANNASIASPQLEARGGREPSVNGPGDFRSAISLVQSLRELGDMDAAARLLRAVNDWYDTRAARAPGGYVLTGGYLLPELYLLRGEDNRAIEAIRERVMLEGDRFIAQGDGGTFDSALYDPIRSNAEFQRLVAEYDRRRAAAAAEVRAMIANAGF